MFELPARTLAELRDYNIAVAEHLNVKVDMETGLRIDEPPVVLQGARWDLHLVI